MPQRRRQELTIVQPCEEHDNIDTFKMRLQLDENSVSPQAVLGGHAIQSEFVWSHETVRMDETILGGQNEPGLACAVRITARLLKPGRNVQVPGGSRSRLFLAHARHEVYGIRQVSAVCANSEVRRLPTVHAVACNPTSPHFLR